MKTNLETNAGKCLTDRELSKRLARLKGKTKGISKELKINYGADKDGKRI